MLTIDHRVINHVSHTVLKEGLVAVQVSKLNVLCTCLHCTNADITSNQLYVQIVPYPAHFLNFVNKLLKVYLVVDRPLLEGPRAAQRSDRLV